MFVDPGTLPGHVAALSNWHVQFSTKSFFLSGSVNSFMDIKRPAKSKFKKRARLGVIIVASVVAIGGITLVLARIKPAAPTLDRSTAVIDTVKRGQMLRNVRGNGTLVPQLTRWVVAPADGRVENIPVQAGVEVSAGTVLLELSSSPPLPASMPSIVRRNCSSTLTKRWRNRVLSPTFY